MLILRLVKIIVILLSNPMLFSVNTQIVYVVMNDNRELVNSEW
ncbi:hypothetical protein [Emticicia agri]|nr:hypothetical protein [Emticicia agri]